MSKTATSRAGLELFPVDAAVVAPEWNVELWLNHSGDLSLGQLRGRIIVLHAFQMLCPGCVAHGLLQAQRIRASFSSENVAVIGLHSVFEHHDAMRPVSLRAFLHEYRVGFPVGIDASSADSPIPQTMRAYEMRGTPTLILIDHAGRVRLHAFGRPEDLIIGASIATLIAERNGNALGTEGRRQTPEMGLEHESCDATGRRY